jgi:hypothetical protein
MGSTITPNTHSMAVPIQRRRARVRASSDALAE